MINGLTLTFTPTRYGKSSLAQHGIKRKRGRKIHDTNTPTEKSNASTTRKIELQ
nr:MAG TPA: hypothetical protein [Caudoviricetes sp.]